MLHNLTWNLLGNILFEFSSLFKAFRWWEVKDRKCVVTADVGDAGFLSVACHHQNTRERLEVQEKKKTKTLKTSRMKVNNYGSLWDKCKGIPSFTHRHHHHHHRHHPHRHHHLLLKNQKTSLCVFTTPHSNVVLIWLAFQTWFTLVKTGRYKTQAWLDSFTQRE